MITEYDYIFYTFFTCPYTVHYPMKVLNISNRLKRFSRSLCTKKYLFEGLNYLN